MPLLILDIGSSSVRALLMDATAQILPGALASRPHQFQNAQPGESTTDARLLQGLIASCLDEILAHPAAPTITGVAAATFAGSLLGVDAAGQPLTPVITYADTRSAEDARWLQQQPDTNALHQRTGCRLHTAYYPAQLAWLRRTQPEQVQSVACWLDFSTYLYRQWFGVAKMSYSVAAWSGLLNRATLNWDAELLSLLALSPEQLPQLTDFSDAQVGLVEPYASRYPLLRHLPFLLPVGDGAAANIGSGAGDETHLALTIGTTAAVRRVTTAFAAVPPGLWAYRVDAHRHLIGGATSEGGNIFQWARHTLALTEQDIETTFATCLPDAHGLTILPLLAGERSPGWQTNAVGTIHGLRLGTTPLDIVQALLESVALRLAQIIDQLQPDAQVTVMAGGGAVLASVAWAQVLADAFNRPLHILAEPEVTARGVALLALSVFGDAALVPVAPRLAQIVQPRPEVVPIYQAAQDRQKALYQRLYAS
jgi:gluconokinase